jgi:membrane associated rhomboid family serine protease
MGRQQTIRAREVLSPSTRNTPVTMAILGITVAIQVVQFVAPQVWNDYFFTPLAMWNLGVAAGEWWRMLTVVLLHANFMHILFNMWALYALGPQIERELGGTRLLALYLASAAAGSAFSYFIGDVRDVGVGASGAIFGLFGVWVASAVRRRNTRYGRYLLNQLGVILLINAAIPFIVRNVSWQAHLGGLLTGFAIGTLWATFRGPRARWIHLGSALAIIVVSIVSTQLFIPFA